MRAIEPERPLVLGDDAGSMSWAFVLEPVDESSTHLITRSRGAYDRLALGLMLKVMAPGPLRDARRQLLNLKRRWRRRPDGASGAWRGHSRSQSYADPDGDWFPAAELALAWAAQGRLAILAAALTLAVGHWFPVRRWFSRWRTTPDELARAMPGDALMPNPVRDWLHAARSVCRIQLPFGCLCASWSRVVCHDRRMLLGVKERAEALRASAS